MSDIFKSTKWVIMSKDRKFIAKGVPRNRHLVPVEDKKDKKRILYYSSKKMAENAFTSCGFYGEWQIKLNSEETRRSYLLEAVEVEITIREKENK